MLGHAARMIALAALAGQTAAQEAWIERTPLLPSDGDHHDWFGYATAIGGDELFVGSPGADVGIGAVYVHRWDGRGWYEVARLASSDGATVQSFGRALALDGDTLVVGAPGDASGQGAAYVFVRQGGGWHQQAKLTASDGEVDDRLGMSVALDGDTLAVGATGDDDRATQAGASYVFARSGASWSQEVKLTASDGQHADELGWSVAVDGDVVVTSARWDDDAGSQAGAAYVFGRVGTSWSQLEKLFASDAGSTDWFGNQVVLDGDTLAISATRFGEPGQVYVFHPFAGSWVERAILRASDNADSDWFGESLAIDGDRIAVGARLSDAGGSTSGAGYVFDLVGGEWTETALLFPIGVQPGDQYGRSIALDGERVVLGSNYAEPNGSQSGRAATFHFEPPFQPLCSGDGSGAACPCSNAGLPGHGCSNSASSAGGSLTASGSSSVTVGGLVLHAAELPPEQLALFLRGDEPIRSGAGQPFGDGLACATTMVVSVQLAHIDAQGLTATTVDLVTTGGVLPGERKVYQLIHRDPLGGHCGSGFNLTNGLDVSFLP